MKRIDPINNSMLLQDDVFLCCGIEASYSWTWTMEKPKWKK